MSRSSRRLTRREFVKKSAAGSLGVAAATRMGLWGGDVQASQDFKGEELRVLPMLEHGVTN